MKLQLLQLDTSPNVEESSTSRSEVLSEMTTKDQRQQRQYGKRNVGPLKYPD